MDDHDGRTALHIATCEGHEAAVVYLLESGASVHARDRYGHSPLDDAVFFKHLVIIGLLRRAGAHLRLPPAKLGMMLCKWVVPLPPHHTPRPPPSWAWCSASGWSPYPPTTPPAPRQAGHDALQVGGSPTTLPHPLPPRQAGHDALVPLPPYHTPCPSPSWAWCSASGWSPYPPTTPPAPRQAGHDALQVGGPPTPLPHPLPPAKLGMMLCKWVVPLPPSKLGMMLCKWVVSPPTLQPTLLLPPTSCTPNTSCSPPHPPDLQMNTWYKFTVVILPHLILQYIIFTYIIDCLYLDPCMIR